MAGASFPGVPTSCRTGLDRSCAAPHLDRTCGKDRQAEVGLTGCDAAIAETGSLVFRLGKGKSRAIALLPPLHVAVVQPRDFCFSMGEFFQMHAERVAASASCTFVTGPSRTADIELTLTLGVHGPGKLVVLIGPDI